MQDASALAPDDEPAAEHRRDAWWSLIQSCCLSDDEFAYIRDMYEDPLIQRIFYENKSLWFMDTLYQRMRKGSVHVMFYGQQRMGKSYAALFLASKLDATFGVERITFKLGDLKRQLDKAEEHAIYLHDEIRTRYGEGSSWEVSQISEFLETQAKWCTSIFFCTPVLKLDKLLYGINYYVEMIGYNERKGFSLGLLKSHRGIPQGWILPVLPSDELIEVYEAHKDEHRLGGESSSYDAYVRELMEDPRYKLCKHKQDLEVLVTDLHETMPIGYKRLIAHKAWMQLRKRKETPPAPPVPSVDVEGSFEQYAVERCRAEYDGNITDILEMTLRNIPQVEIAEKVYGNARSQPTVSIELAKVRLRSLGTWFQVWWRVKHGMEPDEALVNQPVPDAIEEGVPVSLKVIMNKKKTASIPRHEFLPELEYATTHGTPIKIVVYNTHYHQERVVVFPRAEDVPDPVTVRW